MNRIIFAISLIVLTVTCQAPKKSFEVSDKLIACGNFHVFLTSPLKDRYVRISVDSKNEPLTQYNKFVLKEHETIEVTYEEYDGDISKVLCNDVRLTNPPNQLEQSKVISGVCIVEMTEENFKLYQQGSPYEITVELNDVVFDNGLGIDHFKESFTVGWLPG